MISGIVDEFSDDELMALANFCKRVTWDEITACAKNRQEAELIRSALYILIDLLASQGYAPR